MARAPVLQEIEAAPESDRLDGFPHPRATKALFGHDAAERQLCAQFASGRMHHAWLVTGREGVGKATLAYRLARFVLADASERDPFGVSLSIADDRIAARQVLALSHPGLLVLRRPYDHKAKRFATAITVDEVRRLRTFLGLSAEAGAWRVVIVDSADDLNIAAANALLKSLEEPPARALFVLLAASAGRLLPTIRSRCRLLDLTPLGPEDLRRAMTQALAVGDGEPPGPGDWPRLQQMAHGSVRRGLALARAGGLKSLVQVDALLAGLPGVDWAAVHALADTIAGSAAEQAFEQFFDLLLARLASLVHLAAAGSGDTDQTADLKLAARLMPAARHAAWARVWQQVVDDRADAERLNLDRKTLVLNTVAMLAATARGDSLRER